MKRFFLFLKKWFLIIVSFIINIFRTIFGKSKINLVKTKTKKENVLSQKDEKIVIQNSSSLPDTDNVKTDPHNTNEEIKLEIKNDVSYRYINKDNFVTHLKLIPLLDLIIKEELEQIYSFENFKLKDTSKDKKIIINKIKSNIYPKIVSKVNGNELTNTNEITMEVKRSLKSELEKFPLFPPKNTKSDSNVVIENINKKTATKLADNLSGKNELVNNELGKKDSNVDDATKNLQNMQFFQDLEKDENLDTPKTKFTDVLKDVGLAVGLGTISAVTGIGENKVQDSKDKPIQKPLEADLGNILSNDDKVQENVLKSTENFLNEVKSPISDSTVKEVIQNETEVSKIIENINHEEKEIKKELGDIDKKVQDDTKEIKEEIQDDLLEDKVAKILSNSNKSDNEVKQKLEEEMKKDDFFEKDYESIEEKVNGMLDQIDNAIIKYDGKISKKSMEKLKNEREHLYSLRDNISKSKKEDLDSEKHQLDEVILNTEKDGLRKELERIENENNAKLNDANLNNLKSLSRKELLNIDRTIMFNRVRKANSLLGFASIISLPFIRNKYFFSFTIGLLIDNHFNFVGNFLNRRRRKHNTEMLDRINKGKDSLNMALDITYKNIVELDTLEGNLLSRYPELIDDYELSSEINKLRYSLVNKYNKLIKNSNILDKYYEQGLQRRKTLNMNNRKAA